MGYVKTVRRFAPLLLPIVALMACATQAASQGHIAPAASRTPGRPRLSPPADCR